MCLKCFLTFFSISFSVSGFMWRSFRHFDFSFVQGDKNGFIYILLHANHQLNQNHLLKILSFFHSMVLAPLSKIKWPYVCGFICRSSIQLIFLPVSVPIPCSFLSQLLCSTAWGQGWWFPPEVLLSLRRVFVMLGILLFQMNLEIALSISVKNWVGILREIALNL